jgi:hypothetical protein
MKVVTNVLVKVLVAERTISPTPKSLSGSDLRSSYGIKRRIASNCHCVNRRLLKRRFRLTWRAKPYIMKMKRLNYSVAQFLMTRRSL